MLYHLLFWTKVRELDGMPRRPRACTPANRFRILSAAAGPGVEAALPTTRQGEPSPVATTLVWTTIMGRHTIVGMFDPRADSLTAAESRAPGSEKFDSPEQEVFLNLWRTYDRLKSIEEELFNAFELTAQQYNALRLLRSVHPGSIATLALGARLISRAPDITRLLDKLEQRGLLRRERKRDNRRVVAVTITDQGLKLLQELDEPVRECHRRQLGHLPPRGMRELADLLRMARQPHEDPDNPSLVD